MKVKRNKINPNECHVTNLRVRIVEYEGEPRVEVATDQFSILMDKLEAQLVASLVVEFANSITGK